MKPSPALCLIVIASLLATAVAAAQPPSIRGVTLAHLHRGDVGYGSDACRAQLDELAKLGANWVALVDFAYMNGVREPGVRVGRDRSMSRDNLRRTVADAHARGLKVLLKPHLWSRDFGNGTDWHGTIAMDDDAEWAAFFEGYTAYLVAQARLAQETNADGLCVGVEMKLASGREAEWRTLIAAVRELYDGPLTYSANSDEWQKVAWWDALDVVGITAYFPLSDNRPASEADVRAGWAKVYAELEPFAAKVGKPIVFTELGYTRSARAAATPWEHHEQQPIDAAYQAMLYRVALDEMSKRPFMGGVFLWKWFTADATVAARMEGHDVFGLQNRPETLAALRAAWSVFPDEPARAEE